MKACFCRKCANENEIETSDSIFINISMSTSINDEQEVFANLVIIIIVIYHPIKSLFCKPSYFVVESRTIQNV